MLGLYRMEAELDRRKLLFFRRLCTFSPNTLALQIFLFKLVMYVDNNSYDSGFTSDIWLLPYTLYYHVYKYNGTPIKTAMETYCKQSCV